MRTIVCVLVRITLGLRPSCSWPYKLPARPVQVSYCPGWIYNTTMPCRHAHAKHMPLPNRMHALTSGGTSDEPSALLFVVGAEQRRQVTALPAV
jgi:hypothetical protein